MEDVLGVKLVRASPAEAQGLWSDTAPPSGTMPLPALAYQGVYPVALVFKLIVTKRGRPKGIGKYRNQLEEGVMIFLPKGAAGKGWCWQGLGREATLAAGLQ